jgi:hypothetical protein
MGRETRQKLARAFARQQDTERKHRMRTQHDDKALGPDGTKLSPAAMADLQGRLDRSPLNFSGAEANEIGRRVAAAAEEASISPASRVVRDRMHQAAEPTAAEAAELADALAAYDALLARREEARAAGFRAERDFRDALAEGGAWGTADPDAAARTARAQGQLTAAERALELASRELDFASERIGRARGAINRNGAARQRVLVAGRI